LSPNTPTVCSGAHEAPGTEGRRPGCCRIELLLLVSQFTTIAALWELSLATGGAGFFHFRVNRWEKWNPKCSSVWDTNGCPRSCSSPQFFCAAESMNYRFFPSPPAEVEFFTHLVKGFWIFLAPAKLRSAPLSQVTVVPLTNPQYAVRQEDQKRPVAHPASENGGFNPNCCVSVVRTK